MLDKIADALIGWKLTAIELPPGGEWMSLTFEDGKGGFHFWRIRLSGGGDMTLDGKDI